VGEKYSSDLGEEEGLKEGYRASAEEVDTYQRFSSVMRRHKTTQKL
jgi:hypothetical protein